MKKSGFLKKVENRVIENVQETEKNRLQSFLTRSDFCDFRVSEFFNSHRDYHHLISGHNLVENLLRGVPAVSEGVKGFRSDLYQ